MANEIDLFNDLERVHEYIRTYRKCPQLKKEWQDEEKRIIAELKENYPDCFWNK